MKTICDDSKLCNLAEIMALADAATPGPWLQAHHIGEPRALVSERDKSLSLLALDRDGMAIVDSEADARFIVAAREIVPAMAAELAAMRAAALELYNADIAIDEVAVRKAMDRLRILLPSP